jgi:hypothetical protein
VTETKEKQEKGLELPRMSDNGLALDVLMDFLDAVEGGVVAAKQRIKEVKLGDEQLDFSKLFWEEKQGTKGLFQQTSEEANQNSLLWQELKAKLKEHDGFWQSNGYRFWFDMENECVIDRRKV